MNNDLISREALREDLRRFFPVEVLEGIEPKTLFAQIMHDIDNAPTVDTGDSKYLEERDADAWESGYIQGLSEQRTHGKWVVTAEDNDGVHRICCPFCSYEKGSNNTDPIIVTFTNFPKFCENCGADMRKGGAE